MKDCQERTGQEGLPPLIAADLSVLIFHIAFANGDLSLRTTALPPRKFDCKDDEQRQGSHLERQAGDHDIDARLPPVGIVRCGGHGAADALQHKSNYIARDKDDGIVSGSQARDVLAAIDDHDAAEKKVQGGAEEDRSDTEADKVPASSVLA